jgi:hypothetical protein
MDCLALLDEANRLGFRVTTHNGKLIVRGPKSEAAFVERLLSAKDKLLVLFAVWADPDRPVSFPRPSATEAVDLPWVCEVAAWPDHLREAWNERAAILEFDAGKSRIEAERLAFKMVTQRT